MRFSRLKEKMRRGEPALITCCCFADPQIYEMASLMGFDAIWLDLEHHPTGELKAAELMRAARVGVSDIIARPAKGEFLKMSRLLEAGAQAIMYPRCESAEEAAEVVRWAKFAPLGIRGIDGSNPDNPYCGVPMAPYIKAANEHTLVVLQIESPQALDQVEAMLRVPGVDAVMLGPGDFSVLAGIPFQFDHPLIAQAVERVARAAKEAGKWWGTVSFNAEHSKKLIDQGAAFVCYAADIILIKQAWDVLQANHAAVGFKFENRLAQQAAEIEKQWGGASRGQSPAI